MNTLQRPPTGRPWHEPALGRRTRALALCIGLAAGALPWPAVSQAPAPPRATHTLDNLVYAIPPGFEAVGNPDGVMMAPTGQVAARHITGLLLIPKGFRPDAALRAQMRARGARAAAQAVVLAVSKAQTDPEARISPAELMNDVAKDGYEAYRVVVVGRDVEAGTERYAVYVVAFPGDWVHVLAAMGWGSSAALEAVAPGLVSLLASAEFRNRGATLPEPAAPPLPSSFSALRPRADQRPSAPAQPRGQGNCRVVQRQMCSGGFGSGLGYLCNTYPQTVCD